MTSRSHAGIGRYGRGTILLLLLVGSIGFNAVDFMVFQRLSLMLNVGFRFDALGNPAAVPAWRSAAEAAFNIILLVVAIGRLHDADKSGWWLLGLVALPIVALLIGAPSIALVALVGWIALLFWPGTIGPNRFGADRSGWASREQYDAQKATLEAEARSYSRRG
jgi:uncharacterized membrane protein YhaH (DUF805 family)